MCVDPTPLVVLRGEIDGIDDAVHDLLMRRAAIIAKVAAVKGGATDLASAMAPGREAAILRRLLGRHRGTLPAAAIGRIWREIIAASVAYQGRLEVAVAAPAKPAAYLDIARQHFGSATPLTVHRSTERVLSAVSAADGTVGVLPWPVDGKPNPWWPGLVTAADPAPRVIARLPFFANPSGRLKAVAALVVAPFDRGETGEDTSLAIVIATSGTAPAGIERALAAADLDGRVIAVAAAPGEHRRGRALGLVEIAGYVADHDPRLATVAAAAQGAIDRLVPVGGYAVPIAASQAPAA